MNPFYHGNPVTTNHFLGRKKELTRIKGRILTSQSCVIFSQQPNGKTSLLRHLAAPEKYNDFYGNDSAIQRLFSFLDASTFSDQINQSNFWQLALSPLNILIQNNSQLTQYYNNCVQVNFTHQSLEVLFNELEQQNYHLILLIDEFDVLLNLVQLCHSQFLGSLRSLASTKPALSLVIAVRQSINQLNTKTQQLSGNGSPYFNIFEECTLSYFTETEIESLLNKTNVFNNDDIEFIKRAAGGQPYLLQAVTAELWNNYQDDEYDANKRREQAGLALYEVVARTFGNTWSLWSPQMQMAITVIALAQSPQLITERSFNHAELSKDLKDFAPELKELKKQGYIKECEQTQTLKILPAAIQWWLADELIRTVRDDKDLVQWLQNQEWQGLLTTGQKQQVLQAGKSLIEILKENGIGGIIKSFVMGN